MGPIIIAEITVPSRTPARYPKKTIDNPAAIRTNETSQYGLIFPNSFLNALAIATINVHKQKKYFIIDNEKKEKILRNEFIS